MKKLFTILLIFIVQLSYAQSDLLVNTWEGYGGAVIYHFAKKGKGYSTSIESPKEKFAWILEENKLILQYDTNDTIPIVHHSKDSLILDFGIPKGIVIKRFIPFTPYHKKISCRQVEKFLYSGLIKSNTPSTPQIGIYEFNTNGKYIYNDTEYSWKTMKFNGYVFLRMTGLIERVFTSKILNLTNDFMEILIYDSFEDRTFTTILKHE